MAASNLAPETAPKNCIRRGDRVLDVAAGTGGFSRRVAQLIGREGSLVLVDVSAPMLAVAKPD